MFEYVASGTSYFKLMYQESLSPQNLDWFTRTFGSLNVETTKGAGKPVQVLWRQTFLIH